MGNQNSQLMTEEEAELEKKVNVIYEGRKKMEKPSELKLDAESLIKRLEQGEEVDVKEVDAFRERIEKAEIRGKLELGKMQPKLDQIMGQAQLRVLAENARANEVSAYMLKDRQDVDPIEQALIDQFSATHSVGMMLIGGIYKQDELTVEIINEITRASSKMIQLSHRTAEILHKYRTGGKQMMTVQHQYIQVNNGAEGIVTKEVVTNKGGGCIEEKAKTTPCINDIILESAKEKVRR